MNNQKPQIFIGILAALVVGLGVGYWTAGFNKPAATTKASSIQKEPLYYRNPMNPEITSPVPAQGSMGMDYIPVYAESEGLGPSGTVSIDPVTVQNIGVRTAVAEERTLAREINTVGRLDYDEQRIARLHPKTQGWIEELRIGTTGESIESDEILLSIYSPQ